MPIPDPLSDGDAAFLGVNMNVEPSQVPQAHVALADNIRFAKGRIRTRPGTKCLDWSNVEVYENKAYAAGEKVLFSGKKGSNLNVAAGTVTLDNVANAVSDGNFVGTTAFATDSTPWFTEGTPANTNGAWYLKAADDVARTGSQFLPTPAGSKVNLCQDIDSVAASQYGVSINIKTFTPAITVSPDNEYGMSVKVIKSGAMSIASSDSGAGVFSAATTAKFEVEALTEALPSGAEIVWYYIDETANHTLTTVRAKLTLSEAHAVGLTVLTGTLVAGDDSTDTTATVGDETTGYKVQTITTLFVHTPTSGSAILKGFGLYFANRASIVTTDNSAGGATTVKGTVHLNKLEKGSYGYGSLKVFIGNSGAGDSIRITDGPFPKTISQIITSGGNDSDQIKIQTDEHWAGEIDSLTLTEPASVVLTTTTGPASNPDIGPVFQRKANANDDIKPPLHIVNGSQVVDGTNWEEVTGHRVYGLGTIYGVGTFNDPNGNETVLVATATGLYGASENSYFSLIPLPDGEAFEESVEFVQAFHEVLCFRGFDKRPLILRNMVTGLESVEQKETDTDLEENEAGDGTESIPNAKTGIFYQNRMFIPISKDEVIVSDFLNPTRYQSILSEFRINTGTSDSLVGLKVMDETTGTLLAFKEHSVYRISNVYGALESVVMDTITLDYGAINPKVITSIGKDCWFLSSKRGLCSIGLADNAKLTGAEIPVSEAVDPVIKSINWQAAKDVACAAYISNHFYLALPTEGAIEVNKILVYSFINQAWAGYDTSTAITGMKGFTELTYGGARRLFFIDKNGFFHLYDDYAYGSDTDDIPEIDVNTGDPTGVITKTAIASEVLTRGYLAGDISFKKWRTARVQMKTQNPTFTVDAEFEGVNESVNLVANKTYDRTKYDRPYDATDYVVTDATNFFTPYRQDYTVQANDFATALTNAPTSGAVFDPDLMADHENRYAFRGEGRYMQLRIKNTTGKHEVTALSVGAIPSETLIYTKQ
jgi:hypothetical protein